MFSKRRNGFYIDIGCHHPFYYSNTALLHHDMGWTGVNVDIDTRAIAAFAEARPFDTNVLAAVGNQPGPVRATLFDAASALNYVGENCPDLDHYPHRKVDLESVSLLSICDRHVPRGRTVDFLNIDAEGRDFDILCSNDWDRYRPTVIAVETRRDDISMVLQDPIYGHLRERGYALLAHAVVTSIFWLEDNDLDP